MAVPIEEHPERKSIVKTRMKPVILTYLAAEDIESFRNGFTSRQLRIAWSAGVIALLTQTWQFCSMSVMLSSVIM